MPYDVPADGILQVTFQGSLYGQMTLTVMNYQLTGGFNYDGPTAIEAAKDTINLATTGLYALYRACCSQDLTALMQYYQWVAPTRYAFQTFTPGSRDGSIAAVAGTPNLAQCVTRRGILAGRRHISTLHLPAIPQTMYAEGFIDETHLETLANFAAESLAPIPLDGGSQLSPCTFRRSDPTAPTLLAGYEIGVTVRDIRRRSVGLGA